MRKKIVISFIGIIFLLTGCDEIKKLLEEESSHDQYINMLRVSGLLETSLGKSWLTAAENALQDSIIINLPYKEEGYFFENETEAFAYRFNARRGENIVVKLETDTINNLKLFVDLFIIEDELKRTAFAGDNLIIEHNVEEDYNFILRVQPELLKGGRYTLTISRSPSLAFPILDKDSRDIKSFWGDHREGGRREHKGVDIFAPKGTPVTAAAKGIITRTGTNNLGGKVVWLYADGKSMYYAHLDSHLVERGMYVDIGDTLGLVGNTGNAKYTPPHLHFGIYIRGTGSVDPFPFIKNIFPKPDDVKINNNLLGKLGRVGSYKANLLYSPNGIKNIISSLNRYTPFKIYGGTGNSFKVKLPDGKTGYISASNVIQANEPYASRTIKEENYLINSPSENASVIAFLKESKTFPVLGKFNNYFLIDYEEKYVWVKE